MYELDCGTNSFEEMRSMVDEARNRVREKWKEWKRNGQEWSEASHPIYLMIWNTRELCYLGARAEEFLDYCREHYIHVLVGKWGKAYDYFEEDGYELKFEDYPGSADDAATYTYITRVSIGGRPEDFCEEAECNRLIITDAYLTKEMGCREVINIIKDEFVLGNSKKLSDYLVDASGLIPLHVIIKKNKGSYYLSDGLSRNNVYVNDMLCSAGQWKALKDGDKLNLAGARFMFHIEKDSN